jgi:hypothetical protein
MRVILGVARGFMATSGAVAQRAEVPKRWAPGGGVGLCVHGPVALELHANYVYVAGSIPDRGPLYQVGPELALSVSINSPVFWSQRLGIRQLYGNSGWWSVSLHAGVENHSTTLGIDDRRLYVQPGVNLFGLLSLEYGMSRPLTDARTLPDTERVLIRVDLNVAMLDRMFRRVPIS